MTRLDTVLNYLHISLWNTPIFRWKMFYLHLQSSSASRKWKNSNVVRFADFVYKVRRDPRVTLRKFSSDSSGQNSKYCKETVKWRAANVYTGKQLAICPGWLLRKTILNGFQWSGNFVLQEIGRGARCIKVENGPLILTLSCFTSFLLSPFINICLLIIN